MIDLDELHDKMVSYRLVGFTKSDIGTIDALELLGRLGQAEKDAARYRFMRDMSDEVDVSRFFHVEINERDAEIDEAMQCSK